MGHRKHILAPGLVHHQSTTPQPPHTRPALSKPPQSASSHRLPTAVARLSGSARGGRLQLARSTGPPGGRQRPGARRGADLPRWQVGAHRRSPRRRHAEWHAAHDCFAPGIARVAWRRERHLLSGAHRRQHRDFHRCQPRLPATADELARALASSAPRSARLHRLRWPRPASRAAAARSRMPPGGAIGSAKEAGKEVEKCAAVRADSAAARPRAPRRGAPPWRMPSRRTPWRKPRRRSGC